jgi:hypothetical protein
MDYGLRIKVGVVLGTIIIVSALPLRSDNHVLDGKTRRKNATDIDILHEAFFESHTYIEQERHLEKWCSFEFLDSAMGDGRTVLLTARTGASKRRVY